VLLGLVHLAFAFPIVLDTYTLWFIGSGMAIIFSGLLNLVAVDKEITRFTKAVATITNACVCLLFALALVILNQPQVYIGIALFLFTTIAFARIRVGAQGMERV
jgi:hypothetical protein